MKFVKMRHPKVKAEAVVPESSVEHHRRAGWQLVSEKKTPARQEPVTQAESAQRGADTTKENS